MIALLEKLSRFLIAALLVAFLMALLPLIIHFFGSDDHAEQLISRQRIQPAQVVKKEPPKEKEQLRLRLSHSKTALAPWRNNALFSFTPDLSVGSDQGATVQVADLKTMLFEEDEIDTPPRAHFLKPLTYPKRARDAGIEGLVSLIIVVGREGSVENVFFELLPDPLFKRSIESQIKRWKFHPGKKEGIPVRVKVRQSVEFYLD